MKLCVPLSDAFRSRQEVLLPLVDAVTFKQPGGEVFPSKELFLESSFNIADPDFPAKLDTAGILEALRSGKYVSFACDIGPNCRTERGYSPNGFPRALSISKAISDEEYLETAARNAEWLRAQFCGYVHAENLNYFPTGAYERVCEPDFVWQITEVAGIGLLLDLAHTLITAHHLGSKDVFSYLAQLPLDTVREIHISHPGFLKGVFEDLHEAPGDTEVSIVKKIIADGHQVKYLTVEYYGDARILCDIYRSIARDLNIKPGTSFNNGADHAHI